MSGNCDDCGCPKPPKLRFRQALRWWAIRWQAEAPEQILCHTSVGCLVGSMMLFVASPSVALTAALAAVVASGVWYSMVTLALLWGVTSEEGSKPWTLAKMWNNSRRVRVGAVPSPHEVGS